MPDIPEGLVAARYIGHGTGLREGTRYYNTDGSLRESLSLETGDELLMRDEDIYGKTLLHDPKGNNPPLYLGIGRVVLPEHVHLSEQERADLGVEHHLGRPDFEPVEPLEHVLKQREDAAREREKAIKKKEPKKFKEIEQTVVIEQPVDIPATESEQS